MKKIPIIDASDEQIEWFAKNIQQLVDVPKSRGAMLAALIQSGHDKDFILIEGSDEPVQEPVQQLVASSPMAQVGERPTPMIAGGFAMWRDSPMVTLRLQSTDRPGGSEPAHPSVNGSPPLVIQRNKLVTIPWDFYLVLKQAGGTKVLPGEKPTDPLILVDYYEYPMTDVTLPTAAEVAAWQDKVGSIELGRPRAAA